MSNYMFVSKAPGLIRKLMIRYGLKDFQAAGIVGNLGHESNGMQTLHEIGQPDGKGGYGWGQWTASRRVSFFTWCKENKLDWQSDEANEGYLFHELDTSYKSVITHLKATKTLAQATMVFEKEYEGAGIVNMTSRNKWAQIAMNVLDASEQTKIG